MGDFSKEAYEGHREKYPHLYPKLPPPLPPILTRRQKMLALAALAVAAYWAWRLLG